MSGITPMGTSRAGEAALERNLFDAAIIGRILRFVELSPIEEYRLSQVSKAFYTAISHREGGVVQRIQDCIKELSRVTPQVQNEAMKRVLTSYQEHLTDLERAGDSPLSKEAKLFEKLFHLREEISNIDPYERERSVSLFMKRPMMKRVQTYGSIFECKKYEKFEEWAKERNFCFPRTVFKTLGHLSSTFAREFVEALVAKGDIESALQVLPSVTESRERSYTIFAICKGYIQQGRPQEVVPMARELPMRLNCAYGHFSVEDLRQFLLQREYYDQILEIISREPPSLARDLFLVILTGRLHDLKHPRAEEAASHIRDPKETLEFAFLQLPKTPFLVGCLFVVCKMYMRENQFKKAFALMQHIMEIAEQLKIKEKYSFQKVAVLFLRMREFRN